MGSVIPTLLQSRVILYGISYSYSTGGEQDAITALQDSISDIRSWMIADSLKLNDDKTEFMIIGTRAQVNKVNVSEIVVGQAKVPAVTIIVRNLGTWLDTNLTMSAHINETCQAAIYHHFCITLNALAGI